MSLKENCLFYSGPSLDGGTSASLLGVNFQRLSLDSGLGSGSNAVFTIPPSEGFLDLSSAYISAKVVIQRDGADLVANDSAEPFLSPSASNFLFDRVSIYFNQSLVSLETDFGLQSIILERLSTTERQRNDILHPLANAQLKTKPQCSAFKHAIPSASLRSLIAAAKGSAVQTLYFPLRSSFTTTLRQLVPSMTSVRIVLCRGSDLSVIASALAKDTDRFNLKMVSLELFVRSFNFSPEAISRIESALATRAELRFRRLSVNMRSIAAGSLHLSFSNVFSSAALPDVIICALILQENLTGSHALLSGFLETANLGSIGVYVGGRSLLPKELDMNFAYDGSTGKVNVSGSDYKEAFVQLVASDGCLFEAERRIPVPFDEFPLGNAMFYFPLPSAHSGVPSFESLDVRLRFNTPTTAPLTLCVFAQRDAAIAVSAGRVYSPAA